MVNTGLTTTSDRLTFSVTASDTEGTKETGWSFGDGRLHRTDETADRSTAIASLMLAVRGSVNAPPKECGTPPSVGANADGSETLYAGCLTAATAGNDPVRFLGYHEAVNRGSLSPNSFTYNSTRYTVKRWEFEDLQNPTSTELKVNIAPPVPEDPFKTRTVVYWDDTAYAVEDVENYLTAMFNTAMDWGVSSPPTERSGDGVQVKLVLRNVPSAPTSLSVAVDSGTQATLSWTPPTKNGGSEITGYEVSYSTDNGATFNTWATLADNGVVSGLTAGTAYVFKIRAVNTIGGGAESTTVDVSTPSGNAAVDSLTIVSDPGSDATYAIGDVIKVRATFGKAVTVTGTPELQLNFEGTAKTAEYKRGTGTRHLEFEYTVVQNDLDADGIAIAANKLSLPTASDTIKDGTTDATLTHAALAEDAGHKVDGVPPTVVSATASTDLTKIVLALGETINATLPSGNGGLTLTSETDSVAGPTVSSVRRDTDTKQLVLTLSAALDDAKDYTLDYAPPGTNPVKDAPGNALANFEGQAVRILPSTTVWNSNISGSPQFYGCADNRDDSGYHCTTKLSPSTFEFGGYTFKISSIDVEPGEQVAINFSWQYGSEFHNKIDTVHALLNDMVDIASFTAGRKHFAFDRASETWHTYQTGYYDEHGRERWNPPKNFGGRFRWIDNGRDWGTLGGNLILGIDTQQVSLQQTEPRESSTQEANDEEPGDGQGAQGVPAASSPFTSLTGFTLVDASAQPQTVLATLSDGDTLTLDDTANGSYGIRVDTEAGADIGSVRLQLTGPGGRSEDQTENVAPYSLYGDNGASDLLGGNLPVGDYTLTATAYPNPGLDGTALGSLTVSFTVETANNPATGAPTISGTPTEGQTLTAGTAAIADADGVVNVSYDYQWNRDGTAVSNATGQSHTLTAADVGKTITVTVSFTDNAGNSENLTSNPSAAVAPKPLTATFPDSAYQSTRHTGDDDRPQVVVSFSSAPRAFTASTPSARAVNAAIISVSQITEAGIANAYVFILDPTGDDDIVFNLLTGQSCQTGGICSSSGGLLATGLSKVLPGLEEATTEEEPAEEDAETPDPPGSPTNLTGSVNASGHSVLSWTAPAGDTVTSYQILRRRPGMGEATLEPYVDSTGNTATTWTDTNVTAGVKHTYRVKARNSGGLSAWSNYTAVTP